MLGEAPVPLPISRPSFSMRPVTQRFEQLATQRAQSVTRPGMGASCGDALQIQGWNQLFDEGALQVGRQREGLDLPLQGREEKAEGGQQLGGQTLRLGQAFTGTRRQLGVRGEARETRPDAVEALRHLFDRFERRSRGLIVSVLGPDAEIADVLHDVFVNVFGSVHTLRNAGALRFWVDRVTILTVRKVLRSRKRRAWLRLFRTEEEEAMHEPMFEVNPDAQAALRAAYSVLDQMPIDERVFFGLRYVDGMELTEVAAACKVSV